jgi:hypothetical protein
MSSGSVMFFSSLSSRRQRPGDTDGDGEDRPNGPTAHWENRWPVGPGQSGENMGEWSVIPRTRALPFAARTDAPLGHARWPVGPNAGVAGNWWVMGVSMNQGVALRWANRGPVGARTLSQWTTHHASFGACVGPLDHTSCGPKAHWFSQRRRAPW